MFSYLSPLLLGCIAGTITGLIPGIHINLISVLVLVGSSFLLLHASIEQLILFIISMGIIHSFMEFIPSIIFGIPSSDTALSVLPAHKLVLEGNAKEALFLSASGSLLGALFSLPLLLLLPLIYIYLIPIITPHISYFLFIVVLWFIVEEKDLRKMTWPIIFVILFSLYGLLLLNSYHLREPLLVIFTGIFGIASLLYSFLGENSSIPKQHPPKKILPRNSIKGIFSGNIAASFCSILPGIGSAQAASLMSLFYSSMTPRLFLVITSSLNTTSFLVSIVTLYYLEKARNGAIVVVSQLLSQFSYEFFIFVLFCSIILCCIGFLLTQYIGEKVLDGITKVNETILNSFLILLLCCIIFLIEGSYGILCLLGCVSLGTGGMLLEVRRVHFMSILLIPVALFLL